MGDAWELEEQAQRMAEARLAAANSALYDEEEGDGEVEGPDLAGPYCGCDTCIVREVLDAAWPFLYRLAHDPEVTAPDLP